MKVEDEIGGLAGGEKRRRGRFTEKADRISCGPYPLAREGRAIRPARSGSGVKDGRCISWEFPVPERPVLLSDSIFLPLLRASGADDGRGNEEASFHGVQNEAAALYD